MSTYEYLSPKYLTFLNLKLVLKHATSQDVILN
jgi:hypothetical protein